MPSLHSLALSSIEVSSASEPVSSSMLLGRSSTLPRFGVSWLSRSSSLPDRSALASSSSCILSLRISTARSSSCMDDDIARHLSQIQVLDESSSLEFIVDCSSTGRDRHAVWNHPLQGHSQRIPSSSLPRLPQFPHGSAATDASSPLLPSNFRRHG